MLYLLGWLIYAVIVGYLAKVLHPGEDPVGIFWTICIGVAGSFVGGFLSWIIGFGGSPFEPAGFIMGIIGGIVCLFGWNYYQKNYLK